MGNPSGPKQMNGCVTAWLIIMIIANALTVAIYLFINLMTSMVKEDPDIKLTTPVIILLVIIGLANVIFSFLLLKWNKTGFYGFIISSVGAFVINLYLGLGIGQACIGIIGFGVLYGVLQIKKDGISAWENLK
jgi:hypothetical protein